MASRNSDYRHPTLAAIVAGAVGVCALVGGSLAEISGRPTYARVLGAAAAMALATFLLFDHPKSRFYRALALILVVFGLAPLVIRAFRLG